MRTRSRLYICLPLAVFVVLCSLGVPGMAVALAWMTVGMIAIGHRAFDSFPEVAPDARWRTGYRVAVVHFYHIAWWPWYKRFSLARRYLQMRRRFAGSSRPADKGSVASRRRPTNRRHSASDHEQDGN